MCSLFLFVDLIVTRNTSITIKVFLLGLLEVGLKVLDEMVRQFGEYRRITLVKPPLVDTPGTPEPGHWPLDHLYVLLEQLTDVDGFGGQC